jgi:chromosomal replication initiator protein
LATLWDQLTQALQARLSEALFKLWVAPIQVEEDSGGRLILGCPNRFFATWVREHYLRLIEEELRGLGTSTPVEVVVAVKSPRAAAEGEGAGAAAAGGDQLGLPQIAAPRPPAVRLSRDFTFEEFVVGDCNSFAYQAARALADGTSGLISSIYLLSGTGLGKSHLAQAIGNRALEARPHLRVIYATAEEFTNEMVAAIRTSRTQQFKEKWRRGCDLLLLEGVQFLSGKEKTQAELTATLDSLCGEGKRLIFTGNCLPRDIPRLGGSLRSRLQSALITSIEAPDAATRARILRQKGARRALQLPEEVVAYLAETLTGDVRQCEGAVVGLAAKSALMGCPVTLGLAKEVVGGILGRRREVTVELVCDVIGQYYQLTREELRSRSRRRQIVEPRNLAMYLCRRHTRSSLEVIGRAFERDHSTVLYAVRAVERMMRARGAFGHQVEFLSRRLVGGPGQPPDAEG